MDSEAPPVLEVESDFAPEPQDFPALQVVPVEFIIDSHLISAEIRYPGAPRRLVDYLNAIDGPRITLHACVVGDRDDPEAVGRFGDAQIHRNAIIIAVPRSNQQFTARTLEVVQKRPVPAVLVLPGYDVSGNIYMVPDIDPNNTPLIGNHHFVPVTDATITPAGDPDSSWQEELVVVNMTRALLYVPK